jgi:hypothetical protein
MMKIPTGVIKLSLLHVDCVLYVLMGWRQIVIYSLDYFKRRSISCVVRDTVDRRTHQRNEEFSLYQNQLEFEGRGERLNRNRENTIGGLEFSI